MASHAVEEDLNTKMLSLESKLKVLGQLKELFDDPLKMPKYVRDDFFKLQKDFEQDYKSIKEQGAIPLELIANYGKTLL
jgi:hypothetical protein